MDFEKILVLAPHVDDGEIGCGGSIAKWLEQGKDVYYVAFSIAEKSIPKKWPSDILLTEVKKATKVLGIKPDNLIVFRYDVRTFPLHRQEILEDLIRLKTQINPSLVLLPSLNDIHQDHKTIAEEGIRAFKQYTVMGYEEPWNNIAFETRVFLPLEERHVAKKIEALRCYETQRHRKYLDEEFIRGLARTRGTQIEGKYAESFELLRWIIK